MPSSSHLLHSIVEIENFQNILLVGVWSGCMVSFFVKVHQKMGFLHGLSGFKVNLKWFGKYLGCNSMKI